MTKIIIYCSLLLAILSGCHNKIEYSSDLIQADSLAEIAPDSAYRILKKLERPEEMAAHDFAYWCLISGNIFNRRTDDGKQFLPSIYFERACHYYRQYGTTEQQSLIRLYHGRSYQATGDYNRAMQIYAEALKDAERWKEYNAAGMICSYMGDIYQIEHLSDKCKEKYNESLSYFTLANNQKSIAYAYAELGFEYLYDEKPEKGLNYFLQADSIANLLQDSILIGKIHYYLGVTYNELKKHSIAEQSFLKAFQFAQTKVDSILIYYALNSVYIASDNYSKAREALNMGVNNLTKDGVLHQRYLIEKGEENFEQAIMYLEQYQEVLDSIQTLHKKMYTLEIEEKYNLEYAENQKIKAQIKAFRYFIFLLIVLTAFLFSIILFQLMRRQKNRIISGQCEELSKADGIISHILAQLQQEKQHLKKAQASLQQTNKHFDTSFSDLLQRINALNEELFTVKLEKITQIAAIGKKIRKITGKVTPGGKTLTTKEWEILIQLFRNTFPSLNELLWNPVYPLTETEVRLSLLTFFNLDAKQESIIMNIAPVSVYKQRTRLRQTLQLEEGASLFDFFKTYCIRAYR